MKPHFRFISHYRGESDYEISDRTGSYRAHLLIAAEPYDAKLHNYSPERYRREVVATVGFLRRSACESVPLETVQAFNEWQIARSQDAAARMLAEWRRYGDSIEEVKEWIRATFVSNLASGTCEWVQGPGISGQWRILELEAETVAA